MNLLLVQSLAERLHEIAAARQVPLDDLIRQILSDYAWQAGDEAASWVVGSQTGLEQVWPREDFSDWSPPHVDRH